MRVASVVLPGAIGGKGWLEAVGNVDDTMSAYDIADDDAILFVDGTNGAVTLNLPLVADSQQRVLAFVVVSAANTLTLQAQSGENVDGSNSKTFTAALVIACDGTEWRTVAAG